MTPEQRKDLWNTFNRFQRSREKTYSPKINKALKSQVQQFIEAKEAGMSDTDALQRITSYTLLTTLKPLYLDAGITYGAKHLTYLRREKARMPIGFNRLMTELMNAYFRIELLNLVENITATTRELISKILIDSYSLGLSFNDIVPKLQEAGFTYSRSRLIARTETVTAANQGSMMAADTTGLKLNKVWISAQDNRTRRRPRDKYDHFHMDGVTQPKTDGFNVDGETLQQPGDRKHGASAGNICNCRCTLGFSVVREGGKLVYNKFAA